MKTETRDRLDKVLGALNHAQSLNDSGNAPASIAEAYEASIQVAAAYMKDVEGRDLPFNDETYYLFYKIIEEPHRHPQFADKIAQTVRTVYTLHEAYEPALLHETTTKDAQQMIGYVSALCKVIEGILA